MQCREASLLIARTKQVAETAANLFQLATIQVDMTVHALTSIKPRVVEIP